MSSFYGNQLTFGHGLVRGYGTLNLIHVNGQFLNQKLKKNFFATNYIVYKFTLLLFEAKDKVFLHVLV